MDRIKFFPCGDSDVLVQYKYEIREHTNRQIDLLNKLIKAYNYDEIIETIPGYCSLLVHYNPKIVKYKEIVRKIKKLQFKIKDAFVDDTDVIEIPVMYGGKKGEDLKDVACINNISEDEVIKIHSRPEYLIYMLGFTPGFPYLGGIDEKIAAPRLENPRVKIEAGSVGIAGNQTGIYPISSPGGWRIIGQTPLKLFDIARDNHFLLKSGQYIKFKPIGEDEFNKIKLRQSSQNELKYISGNDIKIIDAGFMSTIQDLGRFKYQEYGVPVSGAMDIRACKLANILAGNDENDAVIEASMIGPKIQFNVEGIIAITGGNLTPQINGVDMQMYVAIKCGKGDVLSFGGIKSGSRAYIAFAGGLRIATAMGSKSTYIKANIGGFDGRKLKSGDELGFENSAKKMRDFCYRRVNINKDNIGEINLRVIMGPQSNFFTEEGIQTFLNSTYSVSNEFDRMGCRLQGNQIKHKNDGNIISDGIAFGAIQVPSHGMPIIMLADRQTVGGYTKIANVITVDLPKIAQAKPGDKVKFTSIGIEEAQILYNNELEELKKIKQELFEKNEENKKHTSEINYYRVNVNNKLYDVSVEEIK